MALRAALKHASGKLITAGTCEIELGERDIRTNGQPGEVNSATIYFTPEGEVPDTRSPLLLEVEDGQGWEVVLKSPTYMRVLKLLGKRRQD